MEPTRYEKDVLKSAKQNHIWINAFSKKDDEFLRDIGEQVIQMLETSGCLILSDFDGGSFESLKQKELILRINQS